MSNRGKHTGHNDPDDRGRYRNGPYERWVKCIRPLARVWRAVQMFADEQQLSLSDTIGWLVEQVLKARGMSLDDARFDPPLRRA